MTEALRNISLNFYAGELVLILGPSGSGKTTLLNLIAGLLEPTTGQVIICEKMMEKYSEKERQKLRAKNIGFIFQTFMLIDALTVLENIVLVLQFTRTPLGEANIRAMNILKMLHVAHLSSRYPASLSQGEKQRVAIARAIANNGALLLADEPTASLESSQGSQIIEFLHSFAKENKKCVIVASYDVRIISYADRVLRLNDGEFGNNVRGERCHNQDQTDS
jgi:putative ABC transport system ATP-binding protein